MLNEIGLQFLHEAIVSILGIQKRLSTVLVPSIVYKTIPKLLILQRDMRVRTEIPVLSRLSE